MAGAAPPPSRRVDESPSRLYELQEADMAKVGEDKRERGGNVGRERVSGVDAGVVATQVDTQFRGAAGGDPQLTRTSYCLA